MSLEINYFCDNCHHSIEPDALWAAVLVDEDGAVYCDEYNLDAVHFCSEECHVEYLTDPEE